ncbi:Clp protease N-terminal domain-containing protein [Planctomicrobium sp. SH661]|uniref:Clp protease N-terminal domain-containing protein n=1 Tax=Planctomicrobium sp. SH661 TaxID=3448124 RepID=UPI003F5C96ED
MQLSNAEAQRLHHEYVGTEHVLLGLLAEGVGVAANVLKSLGADLQKLRETVENVALPGPDMITMGRLPLTPRAKLAIEYSYEEAKEFGHEFVGTESLLLGLIRENSGVAFEILKQSGIELQAVRDAVQKVLPKGTLRPKSEGPHILNIQIPCENSAVANDVVRLVQRMYASKDRDEFEGLLPLLGKVVFKNYAEMMS